MPRCQFPQCPKKYTLIVGDCKHCQSKFCMKHRYPQAHQCEKIEEVMNKERKILKDRLMNDKCVQDKLFKI